MNTELHETHSHNDSSPTAHVLPIKLYLRVFGLLIAFFVLSILIYKSGFSSTTNLILLMTTATVQAVMVVVFFMELIHEDKFYAFAFGGSVFFMLLFLFVCLAEIPGRNFFNPEEGVHTLRGYDRSGVYAPAGPVQSAPPAQHP